MDQVKFVQLEPIKMDKATFVLVDTFWASMRHFSQHPPSWQGFMSQLTKETSQCTTVIYNPMLPLNPQADEAVQSLQSDTPILTEIMHQLQLEFSDLNNSLMTYEDA